MQRLLISFKFAGLTAIITSCGVINYFIKKDDFATSCYLMLHRRSSDVRSRTGTCGNILVIFLSNFSLPLASDSDWVPREVHNVSKLQSVGQFFKRFFCWAIR